MATHELAAMLFFVTLGLTNVGAIFEGRSWVFGMEFARLATIAVAASGLLLQRQHVGVASLTLVACVISIGWLATLRSAPALRA